jgi:hypothetical protein
MPPRNAALVINAVDWKIAKDGSVELELAITGSCSDEEGRQAVFPRGTRATVTVREADLDKKPTVRHREGNDPRMQSKL